MVGEVTRRGFATLSVQGLLATIVHLPAVAAAECTTSQLPAFLPTALLLNSASQRNFRLFRQHGALVGLTGVVSMTRVSAASASFSAGTLFLFPFLKPAGQRSRAGLTCFLPTGNGMSGTTAASPIPGASLPPDEYFCRFVLKAPWQDFIGFSVDMPEPATNHTSVWCTTMPKLPDGGAVVIDWASSNLNRGWFGGDSTIPGNAACDGRAWRALIVDALQKLSVCTC